MNAARRATTRHGALVLVTSALLACGNTPVPDAGFFDVPLSPLAPDAFCVRVMTALNEAQCGYRLRCCTPPERERLGPASFVWPTPWTCGQPLAARIDACTQSLIAAGSAYDPSHGASCAVAIEARPSNTICVGPDAYYGQTLPEASDGCLALGGANPSGAACVAGVSCASGTCTGGDGGTCASPSGPIGAPCASDTDCAHDAYCALDSDGGLRACRYRQQNGERCVPDGFGLPAAASCRSTWCSSAVCLPVCIGAAR